MSDRESNWANATKLPHCPNCHGENQPGQSPMIEATWIGGKRGYHCSACDTDWQPLEFSREDRRFLRQEKIAAD